MNGTAHSLKTLKLRGPHSAQSFKGPLKRNVEVHATNGTDW